MAYTVWGSFDWFRKNVVDLDAEVTKTARKSRDYLYQQIEKIENEDSSFPRLYGSYLSFGSFARSSKICPLDDIDVLIPLNGRSTQDNSSKSDSYTRWLKITSTDSPLYPFRDDYGYVNSTKVLNKFKSALSKVPNYRKAEIHKTMQAVTLNLSSYPWIFDVVPALPVSSGEGKTVYYLIPNGSGDWIQTDPRIDSRNVTRVNLAHDGEFLPTLRLLKYWNRRTHKPVLGSYYFETLAIKVFEYAKKIDDYPNAIKYFFDNCQGYVLSSCPDPKGLGPALDASVHWETKQKVVNVMKEAAEMAGFALMYKDQSKDKDAIYWWGRIFGSEFPAYG